MAANADGSINISVARPVAVNFTSSNQPDANIEDSRAGFEPYDLPERVPFSTQPLPPYQPVHQA